MKSKYIFSPKWSKQLQDSNSIKTHLTLNEIDNGTLGELIYALSSNTQLKTLTFSNTSNENITLEGIQHLFIAINGKINSLTFQRSGICTGNLLAITDGLRNNDTLKSLNLEGNNLNDGDIKKIGEALENNTSLTSLNLQRNSITNDGVLDLLRELMRNQSLRAIDLRGNPINSDFANALIELVENNLSLTTLNLPINIRAVNLLLKRNEEYIKLTEKHQCYLNISNKNMRECETLFKDIQDFTKQYPALSPQCNELTYTLLNTGYTRFRQSENKTIQAYDILCRTLGKFASQDPNFGLQCGDLINTFCGDRINTLLRERHESFLKNESPFASDYIGLCKELQNFSKNFPQFMPQEKCGELIYLALLERHNRFLQSRYNSATDYDLLYKTIQDFAKNHLNFGPQCDQLIETLEDNILLVKNYEGTLQMKQFREEKRIEIERLKEEKNLEIQRIINEKDLEIKQLKENRDQDNIVVEKDRQIELLKNTYTNELQEQSLKIQSLKKEVKKQKNDKKELLNIKQAEPKILNGLVKNKSGLFLKENFLNDPNEHDLKNLCLIPFAHELENKEILEQYGAIVSWNQFRDIIKNIDSETKRRYLNRLQEGLEQLLIIWPEGNLENIEAQSQLDAHVLQVLRNDIENLEQRGEIKSELEKIRATEIEQWLLKNPELDPERKQTFDEAICDHILKKWWVENPEKPTPLSARLKENEKIIRLNKFKAEQLQFDNFKEILNPEILCEKIFELAINQTANLELQNLIQIEMLQLEEEPNNNPDDQENNTDHIQLKKAVSKVCQKWFNNGITDPNALIQIDGIAKEKLDKVSMDNQGDLLTIIKREAVLLLLEQFKNNQLILLNNSLTKKINEVLKEVKHTHEQKENILRELVLPKFKEGTLCEEDLNKCLSILKDPLEEIKNKLENTVEKRLHGSFYNVNVKVKEQNESTETPGDQNLNQYI